MPLPDGIFLSLPQTTLRALRATKGDPARRRFLAPVIRAGQGVLNLGDACEYLEFLLGTDRAFLDGRSLHRGDGTRVVALDVPKLVARLAQFPDDEATVRARFLAMDEAAFDYRYLPFWVKAEREKAGITTLKTPAQAEKVARAATALRVFVDQAMSDGHALLFYCRY